MVTGGAGFIGSHAADKLLEEGYEVTAVDNLSEGNLENVKHLKNERRFRFVELDLRDEKATKKLVKGNDVIFHFAAQANIRKSLTDHKADLDHNVIGMINLLNGMVEHEVKDMVFASTSAIYGEATVTPTPEDYMPVQTSLYGASKLACEAFAQAFVQFAPINFWAFRFANVVGERCRRGVVWDFVHKLKQNPKELAILGNGKQSKEYFHVQDCIEGMMTGYKNARGPVNAFNLGNVRQTLVDEVADIVIDEMKLANVRRKYTGDVRGWIGDNPLVFLSIERMRRMGWTPKVPPEEAIRKTARWSIANL